MLITFGVEVICVVLAIILPGWTGLSRDELCFGMRLQVMFLPWQHSPKWQTEGPCKGFRSAVEVLWTCFEISFSPANIEIFCSNGCDFDHLTSITATGIFLSLFKKGFLSPEVF